MLVLGIAILDLFALLFHGLQASAQHTIGMLVKVFLLFSPLRYFQDVDLLTFQTRKVSVAKNVRNTTCVAAHTKTVPEY